MCHKFFIIVGLLLISISLAQAQDYDLQPNVPINIDADSSDFNYTTNKLSFTGLRVTQGNMSIEADYAETDKLDFDDGLWVFNGNVRIEAELTLLICDNARLTFKQHQLYNADLDGNPARFEQADPETGKVNKGEARIMNYNLKEGIVTLSENAVFTDGANRMRGSSITYDVISRRMKANAGEDGAVRIMIDPNSSEVKKYTD